MTGISMCVSGGVQIDSFEPVEPASGGSSFLIKRTERAFVTERTTCSLTSGRANIHCLQARQACDLLDIFAPPYDEDRIKQTQWYSLYPVDLNTDHKTFIAHSLQRR